MVDRRTIRVTFSRTVPRRLWNTIPASFSTRSSALAFLSSSKKKRASARRARFRRAPYAGERHVEELVSEERDEPLHGPPERHVAGAPAHRFAKRDLPAHVRERLSQKLARGAPLLDTTTDHVTPGLLLPRG